VPPSISRGYLWIAAVGDITSDRERILGVESGFRHAGQDGDQARAQGRLAGVIRLLPR
jgi:hypothetical protein